MFKIHCFLKKSKDHWRSYFCCCLTEHFNTACQNRRNEEDNAKKHNATIAGMKRNMEAFLKKSGSRGGDQESQSDGSVM